MGRRRRRRAWQRDESKTRIGGRAESLRNTNTYACMGIEVSNLLHGIDCEGRVRLRSVKDRVGKLERIVGFEVDPAVVMTGFG